MKLDGSVGLLWTIYAIALVDPTPVLSCHDDLDILDRGGHDAVAHKRGVRPDT